MRRTGRNEGRFSPTKKEGVKRAAAPLLAREPLAHDLDDVVAVVVIVDNLHRRRN